VAARTCSAARRSNERKGLLLLPGKPFNLNILSTKSSTSILYVASPQHELNKSLFPNTLGRSSKKIMSVRIALKPFVFNTLRPKYSESILCADSNLPGMNIFDAHVHWKGRGQALEFSKGSGELRQSIPVVFEVKFDAIGAFSFREKLDFNSCDTLHDEIVAPC